MKYDVIIPYRNALSRELEYSVKSMEKHMEHGTVYVVPDTPVRLENVKQIVKPFHHWAKRNSSVLRVESKIVRAIESGVLTDHFWLSNDDFFVMEDMDTSKVYHRGKLKDSLRKRTINDSYAKSLNDTYTYLLRRGIPEPLSYELHVPMLFNTEKRLLYSQMVREDMQYNKDLLMRTIYGNFERLGGEYMDDCKNIDPYQGKPFLSTNDRTFNQQIGKYIKEQLS